MRTTIDLEPDVPAAAKDPAGQQSTAVVKVIPQLVRQALTGQASVAVLTGEPSAAAVCGFVPFPARGDVVTNDVIDRLREESLV